MSTTEPALRLVVARNVKRMRAEAGLSQRDLCAMTQMTQSYLSHLEAGKWNPGLDTIARIARAVGVPPHALLDPRLSNRLH